MVPLKRRRVSSGAAGNSGSAGNTGNGAFRFPQVLFLLERRMGSSRRSFLSELGRRKGFRVEDSFSDCVTHVISEKNSGEEVRSWLRSEVGGRGLTSVQLLDVSWFTDSMGAGLPVPVLQRHRLQTDGEEDGESTAEFTVPNYACQRRTSLLDHNQVLTDALCLLAEKAELSGEEGRGVAFRRAASVLKSLPVAVTTVRQLRGLPCLGGHSLRVLQDILENGESTEVETTKNSERFKALKVLTGIFGVGVKTADRWIRDGILNVQQLQESGQTLNQAQRAGLDHYCDLGTPVSRSEADSISVIVEEAVESVLPGATVTLIGGFRRGKLTGHDVDFLITHPEEGREEGLMPKIISWLHSKDLLLYQKTSRNSYLEGGDSPARPPSNMDRFERSFSIFRLGGQAEAGGPWRAVRGGQAEAGGPWRAVRVDLVVSPISQFAFALLGWTGSKLFERELRRFAAHERSMSLSSHALYDITQKRHLRATTEEEIFTHLGLDFIPPTERNA